MAHDRGDDEVVAFLERRPARTGKLSTVRADGRPHIAPIWFVLDRSTTGPDSAVGDLVFNTAAESVKGRNIDDDLPPFSFVIVEGTAILSEDPDELLHWSTVIGGRYMGEDQAEAYGRRNGVPGELLVRIRPTRIIASAEVAD
jgi:PPOX class probable F420-dependent enzyme